MTPTPTPTTEGTDYAFWGAIIMSVIFFFLPLYINKIIAKYYWNRKYAKKLYEKMLIFRDEEFSFESRRYKIDEIHNNSNLGNKLIISKQLFGQAEEFINSHIIDISVTYIIYIVSIVVIALNLSIKQGSNQDFINGVTNFLKSFFGYFIFPIGFVLGHIRKFVIFYYLESIYVKEKFIELLMDRNRLDSVIHNNSNNENNR